MKSIPAGLEDNTVEIYRFTNKVRALVNGNRMDYLEMPSILREPFQAELIADKPALECLTKKMKIAGADAIEETFVGCRYGALNDSPDLVGHKLESDAPCCDKISACPGFGVVCKVPAGKNGTLTKQEYIISCLVGVGKLDKEIAFDLGIETTTVRTHLDRIREKLCLNNRIEIAFWAHQKGIV